MRDFAYTVNVLVKAYLNDRLEHGDCRACAVGNIVEDAGFYRAYNMNISEGCNSVWKWLFYTCGRKQISGSNDPEKQRIACETIKATGYTVEEMMKIEFAFETAPYGRNEDQWMFNGLMAVVDVLAEIHGIDLTAKEEAKKLFVKA